MTKSYKELISLRTFDERFEYLRLGGAVGRTTFGFDRYLSQSFYCSREWKAVRNMAIVRDAGCDLASPDRVIPDRVVIHHINPISQEDIELSKDSIFDLDNLICVSHATHNAIHYGDASLLPRLPKERKQGDTQLWGRTG